MGEQVAQTVLRLGGSVITVKEKVSTPDTRVIQRLSREIARPRCKSMIIVPTQD